MYMYVSVYVHKFIVTFHVQTTDDLERQWTATNYAFRKRTHELQLTKQELEWQKANVILTRVILCMNVCACVCACVFDQNVLFWLGFGDIPSLS